VTGEKQGRSDRMVGHRTVGTPVALSPAWTLYEGDCREVLRTLPERSVQTCVTSPPYFGLRDYGHDGQIGLEPTPDEFVQALVVVFREVRRVLRDDGTVWLNLGDSYAGGGSGAQFVTGHGSDIRDRRDVAQGYVDQGRKRAPVPGHKPKDLLGIPWMVAFALRADGWYLRSDIIWSKPNPMPESVTDRPTKAHEYLFLLSKGPRYYYDVGAIREPHLTADRKGERVSYPAGSASNHHLDDGHRAGRHGPGLPINDEGRNRRSVWTVATQPFPGAHFATFPPKLIEPCILAGSARIGAEVEVPMGGFAPVDSARCTVLDPFAGSGTTGMVALRHGRSFIGCELNSEYVELARHRITDDAPLLNSHAEVAA
jgi:DNA modification methylase